MNGKKGSGLRAKEAIPPVQPRSGDTKQEKQELRSLVYGLLTSDIRL